MARFQPPRGTHDIIGEEMRRHQYVIAKARSVFRLYGFEEWATPIFEDTSIFARSLGESSDVVSKEMYNFEDRGGDSLTLRPEGTASICRALVSNSLTQNLPQKVFYQGPMFRYERPQKGRFRQFHQIGAELIGAESPLRDAEIIAMARDLLSSLGLMKEVRLELNTLGDTASRLAWREALIAYFERYKESLSEDSQKRLHLNPLRILDSKSEQDRALLADAPAFEQYLNNESRLFWDRLRESLAAFNVSFIENPKIVRGLDYYSHTAFEFVTDQLGAQGTVLAGGRYEGLVEEMGGPATAAIGWAAGIERLASLIKVTLCQPASIMVLPLGEQAYLPAASLVQKLRENACVTSLETRGNMKKRLERALQAGASHVVFLGEDDLSRGVAQLRDLKTREQKEVSLEDLPALLAKEMMPAL